MRTRRRGVAMLPPECQRGQCAAAPAEVGLDAAVAAQAAGLAVGPFGGQHGQHVRDAAVALQDHLGDGRGEPVVAVDLERRVRAEQVGQQAAPAAPWRGWAARETPAVPRAAGAGLCL